MCYTNGFTPLSPVWAFFEREQLWADIQIVREKKIMGNKTEKIKMNIRQCFLRRYLAKDWQYLKKRMIDSDD
ncbi:DUF7079 family protein [Xenorhabdus griffiniae]|uniref:DUF7079 family protein n=1 Tax=Xenorhabdus griffiniae TaxID=351672 RepID=UPI002358F727|nr:hypothetical protein [Xenorhabdus griffiniae]MDC9603522.1 hypothetical protein [Xenorhabdus griffiniae]